MSDTARPKSSGDKLSADEINQDLPVIMTAGETINGATLPVAVYIKDSDGEVYACDGNDTSALDFLGFAVSNGTDGNDITVQNHGVVSGFTGLDAGKKYYVQDDKTLGTTLATYYVCIGIAISATQILIMRQKRKTVVTASHNIEDTGAETTAHNLGIIPRRVRITAIADGIGSGIPGTFCVGTYVNGSINSVRNVYDTQRTAELSSSYIVYIDNDDVPHECKATISVDTTNITLTWSKTGTSSGDEVKLLIEVFED